MVVLDWDQSFSMTVNVTSPGYQRIILKGYITERRSDGLYAAPLLPQLFYGADGAQLTSWRQYLPVAGSQTILSRSGGQPFIPKDQLWWRKISDDEVAEVAEAEPLEAVIVGIPWTWAVAATVFLGVVAVAGYIAWKAHEG